MLIKVRPLDYITSNNCWGVSEYIIIDISYYSVHPKTFRIVKPSTETRSGAELISNIDRAITIKTYESVEDIWVMIEKNRVLIQEICSLTTQKGKS